MHTKRGKNMTTGSMEIRWAEGFAIRTVIEDDRMIISANREGLLSLAGILAELAEQGDGCHLHLDEYNSLEEGSRELIIEKAG